MCWLLPCLVSDQEMLNWCLAWLCPTFEVIGFGRLGLPFWVGDGLLLWCWIILCVRVSSEGFLGEFRLLVRESQMSEIVGVCSSFSCVREPFVGAHSKDGLTGG
ncbi:hypothetical protein Dimus_012216 [Dionaea muscipula]